MKRSIEVLLAALVTGFLAFQLGTCAAPAPADVRQDGYEAERILRRNRNTLVAAQSRTDTITERVIVSDTRLREQRDSLISVLTYADSVLADSAATLADLRVTLRVTVDRSRRFQREADSLAAYTRELIAAHALERLATNQTLAAADSAITAWKGVAEAERRKGWRRFTQGAFLGGIVALVAAVVL